MTRKRQRMLLITAGMFCLAGAIGLILNSFSDNLVFFYSPSELQGTHISSSKKIRVGGLVEEGSIKQLNTNNAPGIQFTLTDFEDSLDVIYTGIVPNLFREGQGMVALGILQNDGVFAAENLLAKHDENYMPKEVADALKKSGQWKPESEE